MPQSRRNSRPAHTLITLGLTAALAAAGLRGFAAEPPKPSGAPATKPTATATATAAASPSSAAPAHHVDYATAVLEDKPAAYWRLNEVKDGIVTAYSGDKPIANETLRGAIHGKVAIKPGPRPGPGKTEYVEFDAKNSAADFEGKESYIVVSDPGDRSVLDFAKGDSITLEAWVNPREIKAGQYVYIVGKGRTNARGFLADNQNYALRIAGKNGGGAPSFVFHDDQTKGQDGWHRWVSDDVFAIDGGWHHIAISYTFGVGKSLKAYLDGYEIKGKWDMGGQTDKGPIVDNDALWIGSSMGGNAGSTFNGSIDEVAIYRRVLPKDEVIGHFNYVVPPPKVARESLPAEAVRVEIVESVPDRAWSERAGKVTDTYDVPAFGFPLTPHKYNSRGIIADRTGPFLVRAAGIIELPAGDQKLLLRSLNGARLTLDDHVIAMNRFSSTKTDAHEAVPDVAAAEIPGMRQMAPGHFDKVIALKGDGKKHVFILEAQVGGAALRQEIGELSVSLLGPDGMYHLLTPKSGFDVPLTDAGWLGYKQQQTADIKAFEARLRTLRSEDERKYWDMRHELARSQAPAALKVPQPKSTAAIHNDIDRFINARLEEAKIEPAPLTDDLAFLRRVSLDLVGMTPSPKEIEKFLADSPETRRAKVIDRLLADVRWADAWVPYWQDVLAENPGILKPELNNTGPFRYYIHEAFLDNRGVDRFAHDIINMTGSRYYGGAAGFEIASDNDVPMAEKAHTVAQAFLGVEMKCARCHDAPFHDVKQADLFATAAMLKQDSVQVPMTSSIPGGSDRLKKLLVQVTLAPGTKVKPTWAFPSIFSGSKSDIPAGVIRDPNDTRDVFAAYVTSPLNTRFAPVIANRVWKRYLGFGIVEPVDDWETAKPSHPELLAYLARELVTHDYDLKHISRLILNSHTYQRAIVAEKAKPVDSKNHLFASPIRRRLTAEQLVDSVFAIAGKPFDSEELNMDVDARQPVSSFNNLGSPTKSWQFTSLSNERDRPALAMPKAQAIIDLLKEFGWRESRPNPVADREASPTVQAPAMLANGVAMRRVTSLSDDSAFTQMAVDAKSADALVDALFVRILGRQPRDQERAAIRQQLAPGFESRISDPKARVKKVETKTNVSWSNHLSAEATTLKLKLEAEARLGDPPSPRFNADWRQRAEDVIWAMINDPEFVFVP